MKKQILVLALLLSFVFNLVGQHPTTPKHHPNKRVIDYVRVDSDGNVDSSHYTYATPFDTLYSVRNHSANYGKSIDSIFYDQKGRKVNSKHLYWKDGLGYVLKEKNTYAYDDLTGSITQISMSLDSTWHLQSKLVKEFYDKNRLKRTSYYKWDQDSTQWVLGSSQLLNPQGKTIEHFVLDFLKTTHQYDTNGVELSGEFLSWYDSIFVGYDKWQNELEDGKIKSTQRYHRQPFWGIWLFTGDDLFTYHPTGQTHEKIHRAVIDSVLTNAKKVEYLYNDQDLLFVKINSNWDKDSNSWRVQRKQINYYADDNTIDSIAYQRADGLPNRSKKIQFINDEKTILETSYFQWDNDTNSWNRSLINSRWYLEGYIPSTQKEPFDVSVFPNPTSDYVQFYTGASPSDLDVYIYSALGRLLVKERLSQTNKVYLGDWPTGIYFYVLRHDNRQIKSGSILKQ